MVFEYYTGIDIGSEFVHYAVLDRDKTIVFCPKSLMHFGNPAGVVKELIEKQERAGIDRGSDSRARYPNRCRVKGLHSGHEGIFSMLCWWGSDWQTNKRSSISV